MIKSIGMKAKLNLIITVSVLFFLFGCGKKILVQSDVINPVDFSKYKTFKFSENNAASNFTFNEANQERVRMAVARELSERDYFESELADLLINVQGSIEMIRETAASPSPYDYYGRLYYPGYYYNDRRPREENESTIIINIIDEKTRKLLWQGVATGDFQQKKKHIEVLIFDTINQIFENFPYHPQSKKDI